MRRCRCRYSLLEICTGFARRGVGASLRARELDDGSRADKRACGARAHLRVARVCVSVWEPVQQQQQQQRAD